MLQADQYEMLARLMQDMGRMADGTQTFIWAVRRSMIGQSVVIALFGLATLMNAVMVYRVTRILHEVIKLVRELIDERTK